MDPRSVFGQVFGIEAVIAAAVFLLVMLAVLVALGQSRRRRRRGAGSSARKENNRLELAYAGLVAAVAGFVIYLSLHTTNEEAAHAQSGSTDVNADVDIVAFQWCWRFDYPGHHRTVQGICDKFDKQPTMVVPVGTPITVRITSKDVIHSWWVPDLRYKLDAFPHHTNSVTFTVKSVGEWQGRCAEFCGDYHYTMDFKLRAVSATDYQHWLAGSGGPVA